MNYKAIIELLQRRAELTQLRASFVTTDTISIGDDPKRLIVLPITELKATVNAVIDAEIRSVDAQLASLGVTLR